MTDIPNITAIEIEKGRLKPMTREDHYRLDCLVEEVDIIVDHINLTKIKENHV